MLDNIKVAFIDLDGTLLNSKSEFSDKTKRVIKMTTEKNIKVVLCSGRSNIDLISKSKYINSSSINISSNGATVYDYLENRVIYENIIEKSILNEIWNFAMHNNISLTFNTILKRYKNANSSKDAVVIKSIDEINENVSQIVIEAKKFNDICKMRDFLRDYHDLECRKFLNFICGKNGYEEGFEADVANKNVNKGEGVKKVLEYLNLTYRNAICFGDGINDSEMFDVCAYSVAMKNGNDKLKEIASFITDSNDEDGVANFIINNIWS